MENRHQIGDLQQMQSLPLKAKITMTERRIYDWYDHWDGDVYVSFSGGKDSTVLKHIVDGLGLGIPSVFVNTGLEYPEIQRFAMSQPNVTTLRPQMAFNQVVKEYGYPVVSKEISHTAYFAKKGSEWAVKMMQGTRMHGDQPSRFNCEKWQCLLDADFKVSNLCCSVMKKKPMKVYAKETGRKPMTAMMVEESSRRRSSWIMYGCNGFDMKEPRSMPMAFWTEQDVLHYLKEFDVPYCSVYGDIRLKEKDEIEGQTNLIDYLGCYSEDDILETTGAKRTGCIFCMYGCHLEKEPNRFQRLKETHPRQYDYCINGGEYVDGIWQPNKKGLGLGHVLDYINVKY